MQIEIPEDLIASARISKAELLQELALLLFQRHKLTLGQVSRIAGISQLRFQHLLASRQIPVHYGLPDFEADVATLKETGRI